MTQSTPAAQQGASAPAEHAPAEQRNDAPSAPGLAPEKARLDLEAMLSQIAKASLPQGR